GAVELSELSVGDQSERVEVEIGDPSVRSRLHGQVEQHGEAGTGEANLPVDSRRLTAKDERNPSPMYAGDVQDLERVVRQGQQDRRSCAGAPRLPLVDTLLIVVEERRSAQAHVRLEHDVPGWGDRISFVDVRELVDPRMIQ